MGKINVAIVDDNERMIHMLDNILRTDENIEVVGKAEDGVQALEVIRQNEPDVVLLDLIMPKLDGLEVMQKINSDTNLKKHPAFIVISAIGKETITENAFSQGAVYFIMKPFENETVINKIKQVTGVGTAPAAGNGGSGTPAAEILPKDLEADVTDADPRERLEAAVAPFSAADILRVVLTGETGEAGVDLAALETAFAHRFYSLELLDRTRVGEDIWKRAEEDSLRGLFLQELRRQYDAAGDDSTRERIVRAVRFGLAAMDGRDL